MDIDYCGVGFLDKLAVYYREGEVITFPVSDLVISLIHAPLSSLADEYKRFISPSGNVSFMRNVRQMEFIALFSQAYREISSAGVLFQDWLVMEIRTCLKELSDDSRAGEFVRSIEATIWPNRISYATFSLDRFRMIFSVGEITESPLFPILINSWAEHIYSRLNELLNMQRAIDLLIQEYLLQETGKYPPIINEYFMSECFSTLDFSSIVTDEVISATLSAIIDTPDYGVSHIVDIPEKGANEMPIGFQSIFFRSMYDSGNILFRAFEYMCTKNIVLARCKNCGKYFVPHSIRSSFCERLLSDGSGRTCKSIRGTWYTEERLRIGDPTEEYVLCRKKYRSRAIRNGLKHPRERFLEWDKWAQELLQEYKIGNITAETFRKALEEADKEMGPQE